MVLPCMGSHDHTTFAPLALHGAHQRAAAVRATLSAPKRPISVSRPGSFSGLRTSISRSRSSGSSDGPHLRPIGFLMPRQNSTWAPSSWRVRSPIHSRWRRGVVPVAAGGIDARHRLLVSRAAAPHGWCRNRWCAVAAWTPSVMPQAAMKSSVSEMRVGEFLYSGSPAGCPAMKPSIQRWTLCRSA